MPEQTKLETWLNNDFFLFSIAFITRLPFIFTGYGIDPDSWRIAHVALQLSHGAPYSPSRFPGYPIPEYAASLIVPYFGPVGLNLVSVLLGCATVLIFKRFAGKLAVNNPGLAALALSFLPVFVLNNVTSMDFNWSFFFYVSALLMALDFRPLFAGGALGLAFASRITYGAAGLPLLLILLSGNKDLKSGLIVTAKLTGTSILVALIGFFPVLKHYGLGFLHYYPSSFNLVQFMWKLTVGPFGILGLLALLIYIVAYVRKPIHSPKLKGLTLWATVATFILYAIAFIKLPDDPAYLLPVMPFLFVILYSTVNKRAQIAITALFVLSPFLFHIYKDGAHLEGPLFYDHFRRTSTNAYLDQVLSARQLYDSNAVIVAGYYAPEILVHFDLKNTNMPANILDDITQSQIDGFVKQGRPIYYMKAQEAYFKSRNGIDLLAAGARELELGP